MIDPKEISAITYAIDADARRAGRTWDYPGIHAAVRGAILDDGRRPLDVAAAGRAAIADAEAITPSALRFAKHYPIATGEADRGPTCAWCTKTQRGHDNLVRLGDPHEFKPTGMQP